MGINSQSINSISINGKKRHGINPNDNFLIKLHKIFRTVVLIHRIANFKVSVNYLVILLKREFIHLKVK